MKRKVVFLDRDGTINIEKEYLYKWEEFQFEKSVLTGLRKLQKLGYEFIIVTNQAGIARGYYTEEDLLKLHKLMKTYLKNEGINILDCYYCPHHPTNGIGEYKKECSCRKPNSGMLEKGIKDYNVDVENSFMVGDKGSDILAGINAGLTSILVKTGYGKNYLELAEKLEVSSFETLCDFANEMENKSKK